MKILYLVKKDILVIKRYLIALLLFGFGIPFFMGTQVNINGGAIFLLTSVYLIALAMQMISMVEMKYPKAQARLCAGPYTRKSVVASKYVTPLLIFMYTLASHSICALFMPGINALSFMEVISVFFAITVFTGIYIPMEYKLGYQKSKYIYAFAIIFSPMILPKVARFDLTGIVRTVQSFGVFAPHAAILAGGAAVLAVSYFCSVHIFERKDLA